MRHGSAGRWWKFTPRGSWPTDEESLAPITQTWLPEVGDCRQELVFIGQNVDFVALKAALDQCLLTDDEFALGAQGWQKWADPFDSWTEST
jgi:hypothetical protein